MPCHKGYAPCLRVAEGDRRVTGLDNEEVMRMLIDIKVLRPGEKDDRCCLAMKSA